MAQGKDLYEENKRLRAELDRLYQQAADARTTKRSEQEAVGELLVHAARAFLEGTAWLEISEDNNVRVVTFRMPPEAR